MNCLCLLYIGEKLIIFILFLLVVGLYNIEKELDFIFFLDMVDEFYVV